MADRRQAIEWANAGLLLVRTLGTLLDEIVDEIHTYAIIQENAIENIVCDMAAILPGPECVKRLPCLVTRS